MTFIQSIVAGATCRDPRVAAAVDLIERTTGHPKSVGELADSVGLSASQLRRLFVVELGMPPVDYLRLRRMEKAAELLKSSRYLQVKQVQHILGVTDGSRFSRDFKVYFGVSPGRFRRSTADARE